MHLLPLLGTISDTLNKDGILLDFIAGYAGVDAEDILDYELCLYNPEAPQCIGIHDEFISAPRLDDLTSACAAHSRAHRQRAGRTYRHGCSV